MVDDDSIIDSNSDSDSDDDLRFRSDDGYDSADGRGDLDDRDDHDGTMYGAMRDAMRDVMYQESDALSESQHKEIQKLLTMPEIEIPKKQRKDTPAAMSCKLMEHQRVSLCWMTQQEQDQHKKGGLLAGAYLYDNRPKLTLISY